LGSWSPAAPDAAQDLTTAKTVTKISVVSNMAGGKKSVARRSTGLDYSSVLLRMTLCSPPSPIYRPIEARLMVAAVYHEANRRLGAGQPN
jgi:hypothetical protein